MKRQSGFTLIELLVVVTISAILLGIAIPSFRDFVATQRVKNAAFEFAASMLLARSEAIKRNTAVTVTQGAGGWGSGWTVAAGGTTLATKDSTHNVTITPAPDPAATSLAFQGTGRIASEIRFQFGTANTTSVRCITVSASGVTSTKTTSCP